MSRPDEPSAPPASESPSPQAEPAPPNRAAGAGVDADKAASSAAERPEEKPADDEPQRKSRLEGLIPDIVRRTFYAGLGAVFTTEEGIRKMASDFQLPKDVANFLIQQAASSKDDLFRVVAKEMRSFLESVNVSGELQKLLTSLSFEIKTEIRFIPNGEAIGGVKPDVKVGKMTVKRNNEEKE